MEAPWDALKSRNAFKPAFDRVYQTFNKLNRLFLTRGGLAKYETHTLPFFSITSSAGGPMRMRDMLVARRLWQMSPARIAGDARGRRGGNAW